MEADGTCCKAFPAALPWLQPLTSQAKRFYPLRVHYKMQSKHLNAMYALFLYSKQPKTNYETYSVINGPTAWTATPFSRLRFVFQALCEGPVEGIDIPPWYTSAECWTCSNISHGSHVEFLRGLCCLHLFTLGISMGFYGVSLQMFSQGFLRLF